MRRVAIGLCLWAACMGQSRLAMAQDDKPAEPPAAEPPAGEPPAAEPPAAEPPSGAGRARTRPDNAPAGTATEDTGEAPGGAWSDIFIVPRRPVLKRRRVEIMPTYNVSMNNPLIRHHGFGAEINLFLSEAFFIGIEGTYYVSGNGRNATPNTLTDRYFLLGTDQRVLPSVNRYIWSAFLDFGYVPIHGKFLFFGAGPLHWEAWVSAGVGVFQTEVLARDPQDDPIRFKSIAYGALLPGFGTRLWLGRAVALDVYIKNYLFVDQLEPKNHPRGVMGPETVAMAQGRAESSLSLDLTFGVGLSFLLPPGFEYKTAR